MPFFRTDGKLVYYAHVPKCGGSAVAFYLMARFGPLGFHDGDYLRRPEATRWTRSSPQHVDCVSLDRLVPPAFFDAAFAVVRHPVARLVSTYHFQLEVEGRVPADLGFSGWLARLDPSGGEDPFAFDNHIRPMDDLVPPGAAVFYLEHGLDALVPWFDHVAGRSDGPRAILRENERGAHVAAAAPRAQPTPADLARIATLYRADFARFGYDPQTPAPLAPPPEMTPAALAARDAALAAARTPVAQLVRRLRRKFLRR